MPSFRRLTRFCRYFFGLTFLLHFPAFPRASWMLLEATDTKFSRVVASASSPEETASGAFSVSAISLVFFIKTESLR